VKSTKLNGHIVPRKTSDMLWQNLYDHTEKKSSITPKVQQ